MADAQPETADDPSIPVEDGKGPRPIQSSIAQERNFRVDGKKLTVRCTIPARVADDIGMEAMLVAARSLIIEVEGKQVKVKALKPGEN